MADSIHPAATHHLPMFITAPGETDTLMVFLAIFLVVVVLLFGVFYFWLHSLPERIAHKNHKIQFEIVAILGLISLFTHMHIFWIVGLLLAFIDLPDFGSPLSRIAGSVEKMAGVKPDDSTTVPAEATAGAKQVGEVAEGPPEIHAARRGDAAAAADKARKSQKELRHA